MTTADLDRLRKVCALLSSPVEGEAQAALCKANELLRKACLTWSEVIAPGADTNREPPPYRRPPPRRSRPDAAANLSEIPTADFTDGLLRRYGKAFLDEHEDGRLDLGDVSFLRSVMRHRRWTGRQRDGVVRSLRRAWTIRRYGAA